MAKKIAKRRTAKKLIKRHNKTLKKEPKIQMVNSGFIKTISSINNKKNQQEFDWNSSYDGQKASFRAKINKDGKTETINKTFTICILGSFFKVLLCLFISFFAVLRFAIFLAINII